MPKAAIPTWCFAVVVVKKGHRFLMVQEKKHGQLWYLPAGRVELGETFFEAAIRETREETGLDVELENILRVEHSPNIESARMRVIFLARPANDAAPKQSPDEHSLEARWCTVEELERLPLRGPEVAALLRDVLKGAPKYSLDLLAPEGSPLVPR